LVEGIADVFAAFVDRYGRFFRTKARDSAAVAGRYLCGLAQAGDGTFASMAIVGDDRCARHFQHFISSSPWDYKPVAAQINQDADRFLSGKPTSCLVIGESSFRQSGRSFGGCGAAVVEAAWQGR
jgi:hypothetical protein